MIKTLTMLWLALLLITAQPVEALDSTEFNAAMERLSKPRYTEVVMEVSYYTASDEGMDGQGITANGTVAVEGRTVAMSSQYPFGTVIWIDGQRYVNEDRGGYIVGNRVDVFVTDRGHAMRLGRTMKTVRVEE
jgi:3D (Asp-Asp-Asp) domain-containing protein